MPNIKNIDYSQLINEGAEQVSEHAPKKLSEPRRATKPKNHAHDSGFEEKSLKSRQGGYTVSFDENWQPYVSEQRKEFSIGQSVAFHSLGVEFDSKTMSFVGGYNPKTLRGMIVELNNVSCAIQVGDAVIHKPYYMLNSH
jgi:hypothetical protein